MDEWVPPDLDDFGELDDLGDFDDLDDFEEASDFGEFKAVIDVGDE